LPAGNCIPVTHKLQHRTDVVICGAAQVRSLLAGGIYEFIVTAGDGHRLDHQADTELGSDCRGGHARRRRPRGCKRIGKGRQRFRPNGTGHTLS
jgi:hypothetical protein